MRKPGLEAREGRVWKSRSVDGSGLCGDSGFSGAAGGVCVVVGSIWLLMAFQISLYALFGIANRVSQFDFREIMSIKTLNITFVSVGDGLLGLHDFQVVSDACRETVLRLRERLLGQIDGTACHFDLLGRRIQVKHGGANLVVDLPAKVSQFRTCLPKLRFGFEDVPMHAVSSEYRDV